MELFERSCLLDIGQTHPSVSNIVKELKEAGLVSDSKSEDDRRATVILLTEKGENLKGKLYKAGADVEKIVASIESQSTDKLWQAIDNWEVALYERSFLERVADIRAAGDSRVVEIVDYRPEFLMTFKRLNIMWINSHWSLEPHDLEVLEGGEVVDMFFPRPALKCKSFRAGRSRLGRKPFRVREGMIWSHNRRHSRSESRCGPLHGGRVK